MNHLMLKPAENGYVVEVHDVDGTFYLVATDALDACGLVLSLLEDLEESKGPDLSDIAFEAVPRDK